MKALHFDSVGGASGDMLLAALIDAGADAARIERLVAALPVETFALRAERLTAGGFAGTRVTVDVADEPHPHRGLADIVALLEAAGLPEPVRAMSRAVFERLADAEAAVHGTTRDRVHFHEVGAMDSIVDIVGACAALHLLDARRVTVGPLPLGTGTVNAAHGALPLPVPATAELLKGFPVMRTDESVELVTPTGAALLTTWRTALAAGPAGAAEPEMTLLATGIGLGHRALRSRPNLVRALLFADAAGNGAADADLGDRCLLLECNLDDMTPELIGTLAAKLLAEGALDVFTTPVQMKKQRPGVLLSVLCRPAARARLLDALFAESTTFGVREHEVRRTILARRFETVATPYGEVRIKIGSRRGRDLTRAPEHDDCVRRAAEHGVPLRAVYEAAARAAQTLQPRQ